MNDTWCWELTLQTTHTKQENTSRNTAWEMKPSSIRANIALERTSHESSHATGEIPCLWQFLTSHHCSVIRLHFRKRPLPSHPGSKGVERSEGEAAHPRGRMNTKAKNPMEEQQSRSPLHMGYPQTSPTAAPTTHQDVAEAWSHQKKTHGDEGLTRQMS
jgi:hypothetical protein